MIVAAVVAALSFLSALVYGYERYYRGPDENFFVGTWRGELECLGETRTGYRFKADRTYEERYMFGDEEHWIPAGKWHAGGEFVYLRRRHDDASGPYDRLEIWHIESMASDAFRVHNEGLYGNFKRAD